MLISSSPARTLVAPLFCVAIALGGCATAPASPDDPLEPTNRFVLDVNTGVDKAVIKPVAQAYRDIVPQFIRDRIRSLLDNLAEPRIFVNDLLQGRFDAAVTTFGRFMMNSTLGLAGMFDPATEQGVKRQTGDFGQTLYAWGVGDGPYLVLPLFGPSNLRDAFGLGVDLFTTPPALIVTGHAGVVTNMVVGTVDGMDLRARNIESLDELIASSLDYYARLKSVSIQRRQAELREARGQPEEPQELLDPGAPAAEPAK